MKGIYHYSEATDLLSPQSLMICWSADSNFSHSEAAVKSSMSNVSVAAAVTAPVAVDTRCGPSTVEEAEVDAMMRGRVGHFI